MSAALLLQPCSSDCPRAHRARSHSTTACPSKQFLTLTGLRDLSLSHAFYTADSMEGLTALSSTLTSLELDDCSEMMPPAVLAAFGRLEKLRLNATALHPHPPRAAIEAALAHALPELASLTKLVLIGSLQLPAAAAHMPSLKACSLAIHELLGEGPGLALPAGPWPALRRLNASWPHLEASSLAACGLPCLETLLVSITPPPPAPDEQGAWDGFWAWAATHPPLRQLCIHCAEDDDIEKEEDEEAWDVPRPSRALISAMLALQRRRPDLEVKPFNSGFFSIMEL